MILTKHEQFLLAARKMLKGAERREADDVYRRVVAYTEQRQGSMTAQVLDSAAAVRGARRAAIKAY